MEQEITTNSRSTAVVLDNNVIGSVISKDGTQIGYRQFGQGPAVVIVHGSLSTGYYHLQLAQVLADAFTVYLPDRRGFGLSGPSSEDDGIENDVQDLDALLTKTGAHNVFGVSVGAIICLEAALRLPTIRKLAIYEPPLFTDPATPAAIMKRYDKEMAEGRVAAALATTMKGAPLMSDLLGSMPHWLLEFMTSRMMSYKPSDDYASFREIAPTLHHDGRVITEMSGRQKSLSAIHAEVLLLGGSRSTVFLKAGLDSLARVLPHARRVVFSGLNHGSSWNSELRGQPNAIGQILRQFFA